MKTFCISTLAALILPVISIIAAPVPSTVVPAPQNKHLAGPMGGAPQSSNTVYHQCVLLSPFSITNES